MAKMTAEERALRNAIKTASSEPPRCMNVAAFSRLITAMRRAVIEECAKVAYEEVMACDAPDDGIGPNANYRNAVAQCAAAEIRRKK